MAEPQDVNVVSDSVTVVPGSEERDSDIFWEYFPLL